MSKRPEFPIALILALALCVFAIDCRNSKEGGNRVVLICVGSLRSDLLDSPDLAAMGGMRKEGSFAKALIPVFPAISAPNLASLVTGCYPDKHCVVNNRFYDRKIGKVFEKKPKEDAILFHAEPLWVTAKRQGIKTAVSSWQGTTAPYEGIAPAKISGLSDDASYGEQVTEYCRWLKEGTYGLSMIHLGIVDAASRDHGPGSTEEKAAVVRVDALISQIRQAAGPNANVLVVSECGMASVSRCLHLVSYLKLVGVDAVPLAAGATANLYLASTEDLDRAVDRLRDQSRFKDIDPIGLYEVYTRRDLPQTFRNICEDRSGDIILIARSGSYFREHGGEENCLTPPKVPGMNGFRPFDEGMSGAFLAVGPGINKGVALENVKCVDVYPTVCRLLGIQPAQGIDGSALESILASAPQK